MLATADARTRWGKLVLSLAATTSCAVEGRVPGVGLLAVSKLSNLMDNRLQPDDHYLATDSFFHQHHQS
jgi:hypothetical protein